MASEITAVIALLAAVLSIVSEVLSILRSRKRLETLGSTRPRPKAELPLWEQFTFTKGVNSLSLVPFFSLCLAGLALRLASENFRFQSELLDPKASEQKLEAYNLLQLSDLFIGFVVVVSIIAGLLLLRIVVHYGMRFSAI